MREPSSDDRGSAPSVGQTPSGASTTADAVCGQCGGFLSDSDIFCGDCGFVKHGVGPGARPPIPPPTPRSLPITPSLPSMPSPLLSDAEDSEETRIVERSSGGTRFVLQFSTGESVIVTGTGLVGRNPVPEPSENFDVIVAITDPSKSVSKTHLEFGQLAGVFWIGDRYSGNGTVVREPAGQPVRCDPATRYRVVRGTRIEIGEQFFIVS
ncbi:Ribonuclease E [Leifsonia rubra CMS 76R]|nr:Ribonuclease E [Leifsonia rubra CMS 76R]